LCSLLIIIPNCTSWHVSKCDFHDYKNMIIKQIKFIIYVIFVVACVKMAQTMSFIWMYGHMNVIMKVMFWCSDLLYILNAMLIPWPMFATSNLQIIIHCCFYFTFVFNSKLLFKTIANSTFSGSFKTYECKKACDNETWNNLKLLKLLFQISLSHKLYLQMCNITPHFTHITFTTLIF
jgi:hypothetical protein